MSFGGGGSGASPVTNHVHTNAAGEGGNLTSATLMPDGSTTLANTITIEALVYG